MAESTGPSAAQPTINAAFSWASRDPEWITKLLLMGLIGLIPIVGTLQQTGWLLTMLDNLRAGRNEVPPAAFRYATRGVWLWLATVIYGLILVLAVYGSLFFVAIVATGTASLSSRDQGGGPNLLPLLFIPVVFAWIAIIGVVSLAVWIFVPAIVELTDRKGLAGAFELTAVLKTVRADPQHNLVAAALLLLAYFIAGIGSYLCFIGVIFTTPYAVTVAAGVLRWYEAGAKPDLLPPPSGALAR